LEAVGNAALPDLVFSDIVMAGDMDGVAFARRMRDEKPELPVLLATGYSQAAERIGAEFPILRKPYKLAELNRAVGALIGKARQRNGNLVQLEEARRARTSGRGES